MQALQPAGSDDSALPAARRASPAEQVGFWLARSRRHGVSFDSAWTGAMRNVRWPSGKENRDDWKDVMEWARPIYQRAYERGKRGVDEPMRHLRDADAETVTVIVSRHAA